MARGIYVSAMTPSSGKTTVALGLADALSGETRRLGFFRPVHDGQHPQDDAVLELMRTTFGLADSRCRGGVPAAHAQDLLASGRRDELESAAVSGYAQLLRECDVVIVDCAAPLGPDVAGAQFDLDVRMAGNLDCPMVAVIGARDTGRPEDVLTTVAVTRAELDRAGCDVYAVVVDGVRPEHLEHVTGAAAGDRGDPPLYALPEPLTAGAPTGSPQCDGAVTAARAAWAEHVNGGELADRLDLPRPVRRTPVRFLHELVESARAQRKHIVLPEGEDPRVLRAAQIIHRRDFCDLTVLGDPEHIAALARSEAVDLDFDAPGLNLIDVRQHAEPRERYAREYMRLRAHKGVTREQALERMADGSYFGTMMVQLGDADGMVSGAAHTTANTIRPALEFVKTREGVRIVSSVFFMLLADRVLVYGDCAVNPEPDERQLADIALASAQTARQFGVEPRVAMLSYSTGGSGSGAGVERVRAATELVRAASPDLAVEGPIQYDAAVSASIAGSKLPGSAVAGRASVFVFPDLNAGNITYKAVQQSAGAVAVGPVLQGLRKPVNDLSRGCTVDDIVNTVAVTAVQAQNL